MFREVVNIIRIHIKCLETTVVMHHNMTPKKKKEKKKKNKGKINKKKIKHLSWAR